MLLSLPKVRFVFSVDRHMSKEVIVFSFFNSLTIVWVFLDQLFLSLEESVFFVLWRERERKRKGGADVLDEKFSSFF